MKISKLDLPKCEGEHDSVEQKSASEKTASVQISRLSQQLHRLSDEDTSNPPHHTTQKCQIAEDLTVYVTVVVRFLTILLCEVTTCTLTTCTMYM